MKKEKWSIFIICLIILTNSFSAMVGVSPGKYDINFEPLIEKKFVFAFLFDSGVESEVYVQGDFAEHVTLSTNKLIGGGNVVATVKFPYNAEKPGINKIAIGAKQISSSSGGFALAGNVLGIINVKVPYPGEYALIKLDTSNANVGEPIKLLVSVENLGTENILTRTYLDIYDLQKNFIQKIELGNDYINTKETVSYEKELDTANYGAGDYIARATVEYAGKNASDEKIFRLGELYVGIINYTKEFERNKINRFEIQIESFWNNRIESIFANVSIINYSIFFLTPSANLNPWARETLVGYFDSSQIKEDNFQAEIIINYDGAFTKKIVDLTLKESVNYRGIIITAVISILVLAVIILLTVIFFSKKNLNGKRRHGRKKS